MSVQIRPALFHRSMERETINILQSFLTDVKNGKNPYGYTELVFDLCVLIKRRASYFKSFLDKQGVDRNDPLLTTEDFNLKLGNQLLAIKGIFIQHPCFLLDEKITDFEGLSLKDEKSFAYIIQALLKLAHNPYHIKGKYQLINLIVDLAKTAKNKRSLDDLYCEIIVR